MAKFAKIQNSFLAGELSPRVLGQTDNEKYGQGAKEILNKIVRKQGGASRRMGTLFLEDGFYDFNESKVAAFSGPLRMVEFKFSRNDTSVIVMSTGANGLNAYGIAIWIPSLRRFISPTITLSSGYKAFAGWTTQQQLDEVQITQTGDVVAMASGINPPVFIQRTGENTYVLKDIYSLRDVFAAQRTAYTGSDIAVTPKLSPTVPPDSKPYYNVPYSLIIQSSDTCSANVTTGAVTLTRSIRKWNADHVGTIVRMTKSGVTGFVKITGQTGFAATGTVLKNLGATGTQDSFEEQDWGCNGNSWPKVVCFHDQRLWYANTTNKPNTMWGSQIGDYTEIMLTRPADDANFANVSNDRPFSFALASASIDEIQWMLPGKSSIFIGTSGAEWIGASGSDGTPLGPLNPNFSEQTAYGSQLLQAISVNGALVFPDASQLSLREFTYNRSEDNYHAVDLAHYSEHMIKKGLSIYSSYNLPAIKHVAVQAGGNDVIWVLDSNGMLHAITKDRDFGIVAWSTMKFGGVNDAAGAPPQVKAMCVSRNDNANGDDVYVMIQRYINGAQVIYLERFGQEFVGPTLGETSLDVNKQPMFVDSGMMAIRFSSPQFLAKYDSTINADYSVGSATGTGSGSPVVTGGKLDLSANSVRYVSYAAANALLVQQGSVYFEMKTVAAPVGSEDQHYFTISKTNADQANLLDIYWNRSDAQIHVTMKDSAGTSHDFVSALDSGGVGWTPAANTTYRFLWVFDCTIGSYSLYLNGQAIIQLTGNSTFTRSNAIANFVVGTDYSHARKSEFFIDNLAVSTDANWLNVPAGPIFRPAIIFNKTVLGVNHLSQAAEILGDGQYDGSINLVTTDLPNFRSIALIGLKYQSRIKMVSPEAGSVIGSSQGQAKRASEITIRFERTVGAQFGPDQNNLEAINFQGYTYVANTPIPLYTGDQTPKFPLGWDREINVCIQQDFPGPCNVTAVVIKGMSND